MLSLLEINVCVRAILETTNWIQVRVITSLSWLADMILILQRELFK